MLASVVLLHALLPTVAAQEPDDAGAPVSGESGSSETTVAESRRPPRGARKEKSEKKPRSPEMERARERFHPVGLLQLWVTAYDQDVDVQADPTGVGDVEADPGVSLKRARVGVEGEDSGFAYSVLFGLSAPYDGLDGSSGDVEVVDAALGYEKMGFGIAGGLTKVPFSRDQMMSAGELTFTERGLGTEYIAPDRNLGLVGSAGRFGAKLTVGAFNSGGTVFGDDNDGKTLVGRLEYETGGNSYLTWGRGKAFTFGVGGGGFLTDDVSTRTTAFGGDALLRVVGISVLADVSYAALEPTHTDIDAPGVWEKTTRLGLTGQVGYALGDFEPAVRWTSLNDSAMGNYASIEGGVTWHTLYDDQHRDRVRVGVGWVHRLEPTPMDNDTLRLWAQFRP